jgi:Fe-S-cluster containining protein
LERNTRLIRFREISCDEIDLTPEQIKRLGPKKMINICPFHDLKTHKCAIHSVRYPACREFPFNIYREKDVMDIRKINACLISTNFLIRLREYLFKSENKKIQEYTASIASKIMSEEYSNHFEIPLFFVVFFTADVCKAVNIKLSSETKELLDKYLKEFEKEKKESV